jgi:hypothetical protein
MRPQIGASIIIIITSEIVAYENLVSVNSTRAR